MSVDKLPVDYDTVKRGDYIPPEQVEKAVGMTRDNPKYLLKVLALGDRISKDLSALWHEPVMVKSVNKGIRILTHSEQTEYSGRRFGFAVGTLHRMHDYSIGVNRAELTDDERMAHDRRVHVQGVLLQGMREARARLKLEGHKRSVPGLTS